MKNEVPGCLRLVMPLTGRNVRLQSLLHFGLACANQVKKMGGRAKCLSVPGFVVVEMSRIARNHVKEMVNCLGEASSMKEATLNLIIEERAIPEMLLESPDIIRGEFARERLTKKFFTSLPNGAIIVGNALHNGMPNFHCRLDDRQDRTRHWMRAVNAGAAQQVCNVYWNPRDVLEIHGVDPDEDSDDGSDGLLPNPGVR